MSMDKLSHLGDYFLDITDTFFCMIKDEKIVNINRAACDLLSYAEKDVVRKNVIALVFGDDRDKFSALLASNKKTDYTSIRLRTKTDVLVTMNVRIIPIFIGPEKVLFMEAHDQAPIQQLEKKCRMMEERLINMSPIDVETHLPSPVLFNDRVEQAILRTLREARGVIADIALFSAVVVVDLPELSDIEEKYGPEARRAVLDVVVSRFKSTIRSVDTVAKAKENMFYFLFENIREKQNIAIIINRLRSTMQVPIAYQDKSFVLELVIGFGYYPDNGTTSMALVNYARVNNKF